jgi:hypothetical protein
VNLAKNIGLALVAVLTVACTQQTDRAPAPNALRSDDLAFSVGKLALGMEKESARAITPLESCAEKRYGRVECTGFLEAAFFGGRVGLVTIGFGTQSTQVVSLNFFVDAGTVSGDSLHRTWRTELTCVSGSEADKLHDKAVPVVGDLVPELRRLDLIPYGSEGFACIAPDRRFVHVGSRLDSGSRSASMMYLNVASADLFFRVAQAAEDQRAQEERLKRF